MERATAFVSAASSASIFDSDFGNPVAEVVLDLEPRCEDLRDDHLDARVALGDMGGDEEKVCCGSKKGHGGGGG
jgi:hypothetical protein